MVLAMLRATADCASLMVSTMASSSWPLPSGRVGYILPRSGDGAGAVGSGAVGHSVPRTRLWLEEIESCASGRIPEVCSYHRTCRFPMPL